MIFFISDTHFFGNRKFGEDIFKNHDEREDYIIKNWQDRVHKYDNVYILGDFCDSSKIEDWEKVTSQLTGKLYLIKGNHETADMPKEAEKYFEYVKDYDEIDCPGYEKIILCHYPLVFYRYDMNPEIIHLHGHVHMSNEGRILETLKDVIRTEHLKRNCLYCGRGNLYNVGCMCPWINYTPRTIEEIVNAKVDINDFDNPDLLTTNPQE